MASPSYPTPSEIAELQTDTIIKEETEIDHNLPEDIPLEIKTEIHLDDTSIHESIDNPFSNVQVEVKQESVSVCIEKEGSDIDDGCAKMDDVFHHPKEELEHYVSVPKFEMDCEENGVKQEPVVGDESLVTYDYPNFDDDVGSMDSNEAAALNQVEACLQDDMNIKCEDEDYEQKEEYDKMDIKEESDLTVTETHLISNKVINTTSTITNPHDGLIESKTTKTLVMEILPMSQTNMGFSKIGNPEEILPTTYDNGDDYMDYQDSFQLNSITGNVLSLEQEAYGLLKAKGKKKDLGEPTVTCPKCPKTYRHKSLLKRHLAVHDGIEKRAQGHIRSQITRKDNRNKKLKAELESQLVKKEEKIKKEGYECTCGQTFRRRSRMETCLRSHNLFCDTNTYPCVSCNKQFKNKEELALHRKRLHRKRFPCKFCPTDYHTRKELFKHLQVHQKVQLMEYKVISEVVKGKQKLKCFMCNKSYMELSDLKCHVMDDHKEPYSCPRCKRTFSKIIDFGNHTKTFHPEVEGQSVLDVLEAFSKLVKAWKCEECGLQFHEADKLAMHQIEKHSPDVKTEMQFQCTDCRRVFVSQKGLTSHRRIHHSTETVEETEPVEQGVMCLECRKICKDMTALLSHMRFHNPDRKYPCKFCDFRFATPEKRKAHAEIHTGDMKYVCFICEYQCSSENRLKQHKLSPKHVNMKEFLLTGKPIVQEAQSSAKQEKIKETLRKKEWGVKEKKKKEKSRSESSSEVACDICGDKFPSESEMSEHKLTHPFIEFPNEDTPSRIFFK
ncbi:zinc finger protein 184-like isoform X2 [Helicoverpa zea]|nr:zinc finger protein 184-like isoform X2 [Helicoverpa zea]